jgi:stage II sporulation protein GA (sporulation sigma-E factor processing peptidase)
MTVYVEAYAFINIAMDLFLLALCSLLSAKRLKPLGTALGCALGGAYSIAAYTVFSGALLSFIAKTCCTALMVFLAFGKTKPFLYFKLFAGFYAASFAAGGTGFGLSYLLGRGGFGYGSIVLTVLVTTGVVYLILGSKKERLLSKWRMPVIIEGEGGSIKMKAFIDSGNLLTEPITALPVAICFSSSAKELLTPSGLMAGFSTIGGGGELMLYAPKAVYAVKRGRREKLNDIYIAFSASEKSDDIDLLIPPSAIF